MPDKWFKKWFNSGDYLDLYSHRNSKDAAKIAGLIFRNIKLPEGAKVLDLACGNGRHSIYFAKKGYDVLGIDLSPFLINSAKSKLKTEYAKHRENLSFEIRDMRSINHKNEFHLVVNLFSSFGYFESSRENQKVISSVSKSLVNKGYFFFDFLNTGYLEKNLVPFDYSAGNRKLIVQVREINKGFVVKNILIAKSKHRAAGLEVNHFQEIIKLYSIDDFSAIFPKHGLKIIKTFGNYSGSRFNKQKSERLIILAQKI